MPAGRFNVIVAEFEYQQPDRSIVSSPISRSISETIYQELSEISLIDNIRGPNDNGVSIVKGSSLEEIQNSLVEISTSHVAVVIVYGTVRASESYDLVKPNFYIAGSLANVDPELFGDCGLDEPFQLLKCGVSQSVTNFPELLILLQFMVEGLPSLDLILKLFCFLSQHTDNYSYRRLSPKGSNYVFYYQNGLLLRRPYTSLIYTLFSAPNH